jgi:thiamine biosynthesis lipoprotein
MDARAGTSATAIASATVIAPSAMVADALSTAAFVLGPVEGLALLQRHGLEGLLVTPALEQFATPGWLHA